MTAEACCRRGCDEPDRHGSRSGRRSGSASRGSRPARRWSSRGPVIVGTCRGQRSIGEVGGDRRPSSKNFAGKFSPRWPATGSAGPGAPYSISKRASARPQFVAGCAHGLLKGLPLTVTLRVAHVGRSLDGVVSCPLILRTQTRSCGARADPRLLLPVRGRPRRSRPWCP
jgi:hypothetical protein